MIVLSPGSIEIYERIGQQKHTKKERKICCYCCVNYVDDNILVYQKITGAAVLLQNEKIKEFINSQYAYDNWFAVSSDFDEKKYMLNRIEDILEFRLPSEAESSKICQSLYQAYVIEKEIEAKRKKLFTASKINEIYKQFGGPLYIFRKDDFVKNFIKTQKHFQSQYSKYRIAYSFKTNYTPHICKLIKESGGYAEVVSDFELSLARQIGFSDECIVYNGPWKGSLCEEFLLNGGLLNVDNITEMYRIIAIANNNLSQKIKIGIRLNLDVGQKYISRFGVDLENGDFEKILEMVCQVPNLDISGLHCHIAITNIQSWEKRANLIINVIKKYSLKNLEYIDLGSGMHIKNFYDKAIPSPNDIRIIENYAETALTPFNDFYKDQSEFIKPYIYMELGTLLVRNYIDFITQVNAKKRINNKQFVICDSSSLYLGNEWYLDYKPILTVSKTQKDSDWCENADLVGNTCLENDKIYTGYTGFLAEGDYIVLGDVGAYSNVKKPPFISPSASMISMDDSGKFELIKKTELYDEMLKTYIID